MRVYDGYTCMSSIDIECSPILKDISTLTSGDDLILRSSLISDCHR